MRSPSKTKNCEYIRKSKLEAASTPKKMGLIPQKDDDDNDDLEAIYSEVRSATARSTESPVSARACMALSREKPISTSVAILGSEG